MDSQLSLGDVTKSVFTPDFSSTYKSLSAGSTLCNMLTTNTIKQSISVDSSNKSEIKESEYKIKEAEKIISKNILFAIYNFNVSSKYSTYSSYLGKNIHTYDYTNLDNPEVPTFKKLNLYLEQIDIILGNHSNIVASKDTGNQLYNSLQEFITEIKSSTENIYSIVMDNRISNVTDDDFIINAEKLFKGESSFKTKKFTGNKQNIASYFNSVKGKYLEIAKSVAGYNEGLQKTLIKFNSVMNKLATKYNSSYSQVVMQVEYKKEELRNVLYTFAMKYLNIANILYSIKAECIKEYLQPSYSDYDELITMKEDNSLDEYYDDEDLFIESTDFEDEIISGDDRQVDFSYRTIELEEAFFAYTIKSLLEADEDEKTKKIDQDILSRVNRSSQQPPKVAEQAPEPEKKEETGAAKQPAEADKKIAGSKDNPASADKEDHFVLGGKVEGFGKTLKELWNKIMEFMQKLIEKVQFSVSNSKNKLLAIINDLESVKKINENLNNSDDGFTFRVYNGGAKTVNGLINGIKLGSVDKIVGIKNADDVKNFNAETGIKYFTTTINNLNPEILKYFIPFTDIKIHDNNAYFSSKEAKIVLKNYFAGNDATDVKNAFKDIEANTEGKAKNNILASTMNIAKIKQDSVNAIINNIKTIRIDSMMIFYKNIKTNGANYVNKLASFYDAPNAQAEAAKVTIESVMAEYFGDIMQEDGTDKPAEQPKNAENKVDIKPVTTLLNAYINNYATPILTCASWAYSNMCDNYYNIFNALLTAPVKVGEGNKPEENKKEEQPAANPQTPTANAAPPQPANGEQPAAGDKQ